MNIAAECLHAHFVQLSSNDEIRATQNDDIRPTQNDDEIGPTQNDNESGSSQNDDAIRLMKNSQNRADGMMNVI